MLFRQYLLTNPIAASYLLGCGSLSQGVVVDPLEDEVDIYIEEAKKLGMNIVYVIDTHLHADHVSGAKKLVEKTGAQYILHQSADTSYDFTPVQDGDELMAGNTKLTFLHTPGHTPEHISVVVTDTTRGDQPWFVLTGHTLMVGDAGRTELASSIEEGAKDLFESLKKLTSLEDHIEVYPGAFSGSVCGRKLSGKPSSTIGFEKRFNHALQIGNKEEFIDYMTKDVPPRPDNFKEIRKKNQGKL
ncbi:glyoxylase-like metal-dependent hydrolase (beta-lactamase superfamily II) [Melghiribacillus thermohalophilus]|uniref:Glyoxylase-like metal-dependent hydrolase (Beta-lactamase superfamily II) n=1 Tax=Melghiribacillus thermohalophilus TaxID=1324956 RepID=A0A4R3MYI4_9BACI|nr:MBL fold metallo-hydrolase [Melghiribacillus thermohalophilus]TCT19349.1 glyoxylase-like metal-dependent hydrolase (beta-lactamase superfamily II) [Melghiribacillus thermohalophilus]